MVIRVDPNSGVPVYRQIVEQVRFQVTSGLLQPGTPLPSTRTLSQKLGVNPMTVSKAYSILEQERLVEHRPGMTLTVAELTTASAEKSAIDQLRSSLEPAVTIASQLGVNSRKATAVFREMLERSESTEDEDERRHRVS